METRGTINGLPCPHCEEVLNLSEIEIETGSVIECDYCGKLIYIAAMYPVMHIKATEYDSE